MDVYQSNNFLFSSKYRVCRHVAFWLAQIIFFAGIFSSAGVGSFWKQLFLAAIFIPVRIAFYCYPLMYWVLPKCLLKGKYAYFGLIILVWAVSGLYVNYSFRANVLIPVQDALHLDKIQRDPWNLGSYMASIATAGACCIIVMFKHWLRKQQEWLQLQKETVTAELQLLKAQVHPHFLFNTLNNIYSFSLEDSPKTPGMILKLSSLLSYMLYECKGDEVLLAKELEVMRNYIDLEKERYGNKIDISWNVEGDVKDKYLAPLLLLPFLENAFKHGTSEQLEKPWLSVDIGLKGYKLRCKIVNSKNDVVPVSENGIGIQNVKKRLQFLYPGKHELRLTDEGDFFIASLLIELKNDKADYQPSSARTLPVAEKASI
jgi:hypothetical protein